MSAISTMPPRRASWAVLSAVALLTGPASTVFAAGATPGHAPRVQDNANMFSAGAISDANGIIADVYANTKTHKSIVVETYTKVPDGYADPGAFGKAEFDKRDVNGVLVLIIQSPGDLKIFVDKTTADRFTVAKDGDRDQMGKIMYALLKDKKRDQALIEGLKFAAGKLKAEFPATVASTSATGHTVAADSPSSGLPTWAWIVIGVLGFFILIRILGAIFGGGGGGYSYGPGYGGGYGGGGGGFFSGMLGGIFGAVAGNWMYHNLFGGGGSYGSSGSDSYGASGGSGASDYNPDAGNAADGGGNFGGGGGDFGGGGGGGDFGGGGGGGDFGGGGGGDFGGGGGGDFGGGGGGGDFGGGGGDF